MDERLLLRSCTLCAQSKSKYGTAASVLLMPKPKILCKVFTTCNPVSRVRSSTLMRSILPELDREYTNSLLDAVHPDVHDYLFVRPKEHSLPSAHHTHAPHTGILPRDPVASVRMPTGLEARQDSSATSSASTDLTNICDFATDPQAQSKRRRNGKNKHRVLL